MQSKKSLLTTCAIVCALSFALPCGAAKTIATPIEGSATTNKAASIPLTTLNSGASSANGPRLFAVPALEPGRKAWVSVYDHSGHPIPSAAVSVNDQIVTADNFGQASFVVPMANKVVLSVGVGSEKTETVYTKSEGGLLVAAQSAADAIDRIEGTIVSNELAPAITYAPAAIEVTQPFVVIGKNLSGKADEDHLLVDGYDADIFSGSSVSLLASAPKRMGLGPLKELYVTANGESSNTLEVDVCKVDVTAEAGVGGRASQADVRVVGTNIPCLVELENLAPDTLLSFEGARMGAHTTFVTPGGENNFVRVFLQQPTANLQFDTHMVADSPWSPDDRTAFGDATFRKVICELNRAEVIRLKRRLIALESRIADEQAVRTKALSEGTLTTAALDKTNAELRTLANRRLRINSMVVSRQAIFYSMGGTDAEYQRAIEEANGGSLIALERTIAPILGIPLLAKTSAPPPDSHNGEASKEELAQMMRQREKEFEKSVATLQKMWNKMPAKVSHNRRLAPPPEPYLPSLGQLGPAVDYSRIARLNTVPPPPPELKQLQARLAHKSVHRRATTKKSSRKKRHH